MNITIVGIGYVGLSLAVLLAQKNEVTAVDIVQSKVDALDYYGAELLLYASPNHFHEIELFVGILLVSEIQTALWRKIYCIAFPIYGYIKARQNIISQ